MQYYKDYKGVFGRQRDEPPCRNLFVCFIDLLMTLLTIVVGAAMAITFFVPVMNPETAWAFPILGLAAPVTYLMTLFLALYWLIRWRLVRAVVMLILVACGFFKVSLFYKPEIRRNYGVEITDRRAFKVMSYNVRSFYGDDNRSSAENILRLIEEQEPDIVCLQEFNTRLAAKAEWFETIRDRYTLASADNRNITDSLPHVEMLIMSKYPILRSGAASNPESSIWADLIIGGDTVRILNNHLHTTHINNSDEEYLSNREFLYDSLREMKIRSIVRRFRENSVIRAVQVDSIARAIDDWRERSIVCGDFNDTPVSYTYRVMSEGLNDAFREAGSGYSYTYRGFYNMLRIDYILFSDRFEALSYEVLPVEYSDHLPVIVKLKKL